MNLPMIPSPGASLVIADVIALESSIAQHVMSVNDVEQLEEMRAKADALAHYLQGKELHGPMLGAQRRIEARIGQLLGDATEAQLSGKPCYCSNKVNNRQRVEFRVLSRGLGQLTDDDWRQSRASLLSLIRERFPMARRTPSEVVTTEGKVKKSREERVREIQNLAAQGNRAGQIATELGIGEERVRELARSASITLPDAAIGRVLRPDSKRILTETVNGVDAYVSGLSMLDDVGLPELDMQEQNDLMQALSRSINGLKKLRAKMEKQYAGSNATAA